MTMTDPIADMLTRLRNANQAYHDTVSMPSSKLKVNIAKMLKTEGYISGFEVTDAEVGKTLTLTLKYGRTAAAPSRVFSVSPSPVCASTQSPPTCPRSSAASEWRSCPLLRPPRPTSRPSPRVWAAKSSPTSGERREGRNTMSRIGRLPVPVPAGVDVTINGNDITVKGPKGTLSRTISAPCRSLVEDGSSW